jgi:hypothetical protein
LREPYDKLQSTGAVITIGYPRRASSCARLLKVDSDECSVSQCSGLHDDFHAVVFLLVEDFAGVRRLTQRQAVSDDVVQSNLSLFDPGQQFSDVFLRWRLTETAA